MPATRTAKPSCAKPSEHARNVFVASADEIAARGAAQKGLTWFYARPPVVGLEFEMDVRCVPVERVI